MLAAMVGVAAARLLLTLAIDIMFSPGTVSIKGIGRELQNLSRMIAENFRGTGIAKAKGVSE